MKPESYLSVDETQAAPTLVREDIAPKATATIIPKAPSSPIAPTATLPLKSTPTITLQLCSPLGWETIPELYEIVSDPYKPPPAGSDEERHHGVDFAHYERKGHKSILGEPIHSVLVGVVAASVVDRLPYGNMVIIETGGEFLPDGLKSEIGLKKGQSLYVLYAHMDQAPLVNLGESVLCGQQLGFAGKSGYNIVNEHVHLETRLGPSEVQFNSMAFYTTDATLEEMEQYKRWRTGGEFQHFDPFRLFDSRLEFDAVR